VTRLGKLKPPPEIPPPNPEADGVDDGNVKELVAACNPVKLLKVKSSCCIFFFLSLAVAGWLSNRASTNSGNVGCAISDICPPLKLEANGYNSSES